MSRPPVRKKYCAHSFPSRCRARLARQPRRPLRSRPCLEYRVAVAAVEPAHLVPPSRLLPPLRQHSPCLGMLNRAAAHLAHPPHINHRPNRRRSNSTNQRSLRHLVRLHRFSRHLNCSNRSNSRNRHSRRFLRLRLRLRRAASRTTHPPMAVAAVQRAPKCARFFSRVDATRATSAHTCTTRQSCRRQVLPAATLRLALPRLVSTFNKVDATRVPHVPFHTTRVPRAHRRALPRPRSMA